MNVSLPSVSSDIPGFPDTPWIASYCPGTLRSGLSCSFTSGPQRPSGFMVMQVWTTDWETACWRAKK